MLPAEDVSKNQVLNSRRACAIALLIALLTFIADCWITVRLSYFNAARHIVGWSGPRGPLLIIFVAALAWGMVMSWIRTHGRERMFVAGLFTYPTLVTLLAGRLHAWDGALRIAALLGPVTAILAAFSLLLDPSMDRRETHDLNRAEPQ